MRTEVVVGDTRDFGIGRRVNAENWHALRAVGDNANIRLCDAQAADAQPAPDVVTFNQVTLPSNIDGLHAAGLRFGIDGSWPSWPPSSGSPTSWPASTTASSSSSSPPLGRALHLTPGPTTCAASDERSSSNACPLQPLPARLARPTGRRAHHQGPRPCAHPGLAWLDRRLPPDVAARSPLALAWRNLDKTLDEFIDDQVVAA